MTDSQSGGAGSEPEPSDKLLVVGLGASAGGIEALRAFFANVPQHSGSAYVVILHLSPDHDSKLAEVLQMTAAIPVTQVSEPVRIEADHVYVVPPNRRLDIAEGMLRVRRSRSRSGDRQWTSSSARSRMRTARARCASCCREPDRMGRRA